MEDYKHPSWRIPNGNGLVHPTKSVYDDVFGGPPKFAAAPYMAPTATARVEDYAEIFGGFGGGGGSSIPVLDLPPAVDAVDPRSSVLDYDEIFGGFDGGDFGVPYEELFMEVKKERNPVKPNSERASSVKVNGDAVSLPDKNGNQFSTNGDSNHLHGSTKQLNMDYHKISRNDEDAMNGTTHIAQLHAVPRYSFVIDGSSDCLTESIAVEPKSNGKAEHLKKDESHSTSSSSRNSRDDLKACQDPFSPKSNASSDLSSSDQNQSHHSGSRPTSSRGRSSPTNSFITISDVNLRTQPTCVPPPSRPPPKLPIKWESRAVAKPKVDKSFHVASFSRARPHEEAAKDSSPPFLDVEVDAGSAVAASVAAMKEAMEQAQMRLKSAKESMQRKKDNLHSRKKSFQSEGPKSNDHRAAQEVFPHKQEIAQEVAEEGAYKMNGFSGEQIPETAKEADVAVEFEEKEKSIGISEKQITQRKQPSDPPAKQKEDDKVVHWKVEKQFFELVQGKQERCEKNVVHEKTEKKKSRADMESCELEEKKELKAARDENNERRSAEETRESNETVKSLKTGSRAYDHHESHTKLAEEAHKYDESEKKRKAAMEAHDREVRLVEEARRQEDREKKLAEDESEKSLNAAKVALQREERENNLAEETRQNEEIKSKLVEESRMPEEGEGRLNAEKETLECEEGGRKHKENEKRLAEEACLCEESKKKMKAVKEALDCEERERKLAEAVCKIEENEKSAIMLEESEKKEALEREEREMKAKICEENARKEANEHEESEKRAHIREENERKEALGREEREMKDHIREENERKEALEREEREMKDHIHEENERKEVLEREERERKAHIREENERKAALERAEREKKTHIREENERKEALEREEREKKAHTRDENERKEALICEEREKKAHVHEENDKNDALKCEERGKKSTKEGQGLEEIGMKTTDGKVGSGQMDSKPSQVESAPIKKENENIRTAARLSRQEENIEIGSGVIRQSNDIGVDVSRKLEESNKKTKTAQEVCQRVQNGKEFEATQHEISPRENEEMPKPALHVPKNQIGPEESKQDHRKMDKEEMIQREREQEKVRLRKHEEEIEREKEREKDRIAVERATREAHERVMVESRQRAERAAVDKATAEVRQRAMAEAREKAEKATAEAREKSLADKAAVESKLRAQQRAAVERATAEARERAAEKAFAEKAALDARERAERSFSEKSTAPSRDRQSTSVIQDVRGVSHDQQFHNGGSSNAFFHGKFQGAEFDSPRRCKARLERHQRTVERAAKALAEKNFRDILAQREQAERNRLADTLDADVRRWSNGKEGNLRALISTLQYILGPESGWQPVPLTEVITAQAVRKAYRKATLCVHPDKLQQRGASIRQKYVCEKVFDLLKEAWNKFDSEER